MERTTAYRLAGAVLVVGTVYGLYELGKCFSLRSEACQNWLEAKGGEVVPTSNAGQGILADGSGQDATNTAEASEHSVTIAPPGIAGSLPIYQTLTDPETGDSFEVVHVNGARCIRLNEFRHDDWQDVFRASINLEATQTENINNQQFHVYLPDLTLK